MARKKAKEKASLPTEIVVVMDESGSMESVRSDAIGGFNAFLAEQQKLPGAANLTLVKFNTMSTVVHDRVALSTVPKLDEKAYIPGGCTALYDAIGEAISTIKKTAADAKMVVVAILTDGQENSSHEETKDSIKKRIEACEKEGWKFLFLAADQDAWAAGDAIGIGTSIGTHSGSRGIKMSYAATSHLVTSYRTNCGAVCDSAVKTAQHIADDVDTASP